MAMKKNSDPADNQKSQSFKRNYEGTSVTKMIEKQEKAAHENDNKDTERKALPVELESDLDWFRDNHDIVVAGCALGALILTLVYSVFAGLQWSAMLDSNKISRSSLEIVQRAFLTLRPLNMDAVTRRGPSGDVRDIVLTATWENTGATEAKRVIKYFGVDEINQDELTEEQFRGKKPLPTDAIPTVIAARSSDINPQSIEKPNRFFLGELLDVPPEQRFGGALKKRNVVVWGWAAYRDVFRHDHLAEFCLKMHGFEITPIFQAPSSSSIRAVSTTTAKMKTAKISMTLCRW